MRTAWVRSGLDRFVLARLEQAGLAPSEEADRRTLARRLSFDLTGLPPAPEAVAEFAADTSAGAYARLVDRLLESPRFGEHWARLWLDVVRYSDSNGYDWDEFRPHAWRFRDYVIRCVQRRQAIRSISSSSNSPATSCSRARRATPPSRMP